MVIVKCTWCRQKVNKVNDSGICKSCWCPEGGQWRVSAKTKKDMIEDGSPGVYG